MTRVIVNGTFDILHLGHLKMLEMARSFPDSYVYVLIDSDDRVKELKGNDRPINRAHERAEMLRALRSVDQVEIFNTSEELEQMIKDYNPDVMVKGSDYQNKNIIGAKYCKEIKFYDYIHGYSTTEKIQSITSR